MWCRFSVWIRWRWNLGHWENLLRSRAGRSFRFLIWYVWIGEIKRTRLIYYFSCWSYFIGVNIISLKQGSSWTFNIDTQVTILTLMLVSVCLCQNLNQGSSRTFNMNTQSHKFVVDARFSLSNLNLGSSWTFNINTLRHHLSLMLVLVCLSDLNQGSSWTFNINNKNNNVLL